MPVFTKLLWNCTALLFNGKKQFFDMILTSCYSNQGSNNMVVELLQSSDDKDIYIAQSMINANIAKVKERYDVKTASQVAISPYQPG